MAPFFLHTYDYFVTTNLYFLISLPLSPRPPTPVYLVTIHHSLYLWDILVIFILSLFFPSSWSSKALLLHALYMYLSLHSPESPLSNKIKDIFQWNFLIFNDSQEMDFIKRLEILFVYSYVSLPWTFYISS